MDRDYWWVVPLTVLATLAGRVAVRCTLGALAAAWGRHKRAVVHIFVYDVVYPNGNRKEVMAHDSREAVEIVADDVNLRHDVVVYLGGRVVGVVRYSKTGRHAATWF